MTAEDFRNAKWHLEKFQNALDVLNSPQHISDGELRDLQVLPGVLKDDAEELGADIIYFDDIELRRKYVNVVHDIVKALSAGLA